MKFFAIAMKTTNIRHSSWPLIRYDVEEKSQSASQPSSPDEPLRLVAIGNHDGTLPFHPWILLTKPNICPVQADQPFCSNLGEGWIHKLEHFAASRVVMQASIRPHHSPHLVHIVFIAVPRDWVMLYEHEDRYYIESQLRINLPQRPVLCGETSAPDSTAASNIFDR